MLNRIFDFFTNIAKWILSGLLILTVIAGGIAFYAFSIDWNKEADALVKQISHSLGREMIIRGGVKLEFKPFPQVVVEDVVVHNISGASQEFFFTAERVIAEPSLLSFIGGDASSSRVKIVRGKLYLEWLKDGRQNWRLDGTAAQAGSGAPMPSIVFSDVETYFLHQQSGYAQKLGYLDGNLDVGGPDGPYRIDASLRGDGVTTGVKARIGNLKESTPEFELALMPGASELVVSGKLQRANAYAFSGKFEAHLDPSLLPFAEALGLSSSIGQAFAPKDAQAGDTRIFMTSIASFSQSTLKLNDLTMHADAVKGIGEMTLTFAEKPKLDVNIVLEKLDLDREGLLAEGAETFRADNFVEGNVAPENYRRGAVGFGKYYDIDLLNEAEVEINISAAEVQFRKEAIRNIRLNLRSTGNGQLQARNVSAALPGETQLSMSGVITDDGSVQALPLKFQGAFGLEGRDLLTFLTWLKVDLPPITPGRLKIFSVSNNLTISSRELYFEGLVAKVDNTTIQGGKFVVKRTGDESSTLTLTLDELDLDEYIPEMSNLLADPDRDAGNPIYKLNEPLKKFDLLRSVEGAFGSLDFSITVRDLTYHGQHFSQASAFIRFGSGLMSLEEMTLESPGISLSGTVKIDATNLRPYLAFDLNFKHLDIDQFPKLKIFRTGETAKAPAMAAEQPMSPRWSQEIFSTSPLKYYDGKLRAYFGKLHYADMDMSDVNMDIELNRQQLLIKKIRGQIFDGKFEISQAVMSIADVPAGSAYLSFVNVDTGQFLKRLMGATRLEGRVSLNAFVSSVGNTVRDVIAQSQGSGSIRARPVQTKGFDLPSLTNELIKVSSLQAMRQSIRKYVTAGMTSFSDAYGGFRIGQGVFGFDNFLMVHGMLPETRVQGVINFGTWEYNIRSDYALPLDNSMTQQVKVKEISERTRLPIVQSITGSIDAPEEKWDTKKVEDLWERRFYRR